MNHAESVNMSCCNHCQGLEKDLFNKRNAAKELKEFRREGASDTTKLLVEALEATDVTGCTLLDIGGGIGAIQHALLGAGVRQATHVDASAAYLDASLQEAERQGHAAQTRYVHGDFVVLAPDIAPADIVTLDRVICCYPDMPALVELSAARASRLYGLVFPRESWWSRLGMQFVNFGSWLLRRPYRFFVHPTASVEAILQRHGFERCFYRQTWLWQVVVYRRKT